MNSRNEAEVASLQAKRRTGIVVTKDPQEQFFILPLILSAKRKIIIIWTQEISNQKESQEPALH